LRRNYLDVVDIATIIGDLPLEMLGETFKVILYLISVLCCVDESLEAIFFY
jgi:hypothetical protein